MKLMTLIFIGLFFPTMKALGGVELKNIETGFCLDALRHDASANSSFGDIYEGRCHGGANQKWTFEKLSPDTFQIVNDDSGWCIDLVLAGPRTGLFREHPCHGGPNQTFRLAKKSESSFQVVSLYNSTCFDLRRHTNAMYNYGSLISGPCHTGLNQVFTVSPHPIPAPISFERPTPTPSPRPAPDSYASSDPKDPWHWPKGHGICQGSLTYERLNACDHGQNPTQPIRQITGYHSQPARCPNKVSDYLRDYGTHADTKDLWSQPGHEGKVRYLCPEKPHPDSSRKYSLESSPTYLVERNCTKRNFDNSCKEYKYLWRTECHYREYALKGTRHPSCGTTQNFDAPIIAEVGFYPYHGYDASCGSQTIGLPKNSSMTQLAQDPATKRGSLYCSTGDELPTHADTVNEKMRRMTQELDTLSATGQTTEFNELKDSTLSLLKSYRDHIGSQEKAMFIDLIARTHEPPATCEEAPTQLNQFLDLMELSHSEDQTKVWEAINKAFQSLPSSCRPEALASLINHASSLIMDSTPSFDPADPDLLSEGGPMQAVYVILDHLFSLLRSDPSPLGADTFQKFLNEGWPKIQNAVLASYLTYLKDMESDASAIGQLDDWSLALLNLTDPISEPYVIDLAIEPTRQRWLERLRLQAKISDLLCLMSDCQGANPLKDLLDSTSNLQDPQSSELAAKLNEASEKIAQFYSLDHPKDPQSNIKQIFESPLSHYTDFQKTIRKMLQNKSLTGFYSYKDPSKINAGLDEATRSKVNLGLTDRLSQLRTLRNTIQANKDDFFSSYQTYLQTKSLHKAHQRELEVLAMDLEDKLSAFLATRTNYQERRSRQNAFLDEVADLKAATLQDDPLFELMETDEINVAASLAPNEDTFEKATLESLSYEKAPMVRLKEGEVLSTRVTGSWTPVCAIKRALPGLLKGIHPQIGSQGFQIVNSDQKSKFISYSASRSEEAFESSRSQMSLDISGGVQGDAGSFMGTFSQNFAEGESTTTATQQSKGASSTQSTSKSLYGGQRLPHTPLPTFPAAALLMVAVPSQSNSFDQADIRVLSSQDTYVAPFDMDLYLIINDCNDADNKGSLGLSYQLKKSQHKSAQAMLTKMTQGLETIRQRLSQILDEKTLSAVNMEALRSEIMKDFTPKSSDELHLNQVPFLSSAFKAWVDEEVALFEYQVRMMESQKAILELQKRIQSYEVQQEITATQLQLSYHRSLRTAQNFELSYLKPEIHDLFTYIETYIYPYLLVKDHSVRQTLSQLNQDLATLSLDAPFDSLADLIDRLAQEISLGLMSPPEDTWVKSTKLISLTFPKPGTKAPSHIPVADAYRSKLVWDQLFKSRSDASITITPEDLYDKAPQQALSCGFSLPVVLDQFLILGLNELSTGELSRHNGANVQTLIGPEFTLPDHNKLSTFTLGRRDFGQKIHHVSFIDERDLLGLPQIHRTSGLIKGVGRGFSPFASYAFDDSLFFLTKEYPTDDQGYPEGISSVTLAFEVEVRADPSAIKPGISHCREDTL